MTAEKLSASQISSNVRKARINLLVSVFRRVVDEKRTVYREALISELSLKYGVSRRTALEYINTALYVLHFPDIFTKKPKERQRLLKI